MSNSDKKNSTKNKRIGAVSNSGLSNLYLRFSLKKNNLFKFCIDYSSFEYSPSTPRPYASVASKAFLNSPSFSIQNDGIGLHKPSTQQYRAERRAARAVNRSGSSNTLTLMFPAGLDTQQRRTSTLNLQQPFDVTKITLNNETTNLLLKNEEDINDSTVDEQKCSG